MGKKGSWFSAVKKALTPDSKEKKDQQKTRKPKKKWFGKKSSGGSGDSDEATTVSSVTAAEQSEPPPCPPPAKLREIENEQSKHAYSVALASAAAAEAAVAAAHAAAEVVRLTAPPRFRGESRDEIAAIRIQTAFRGYLARRALKALRGLVRLRTLIHGQSVKRQANATLRCMQTLARLQSQIRTRRIRMSEENLAFQRQLQQKTEKELDKLRSAIGEDWNDSTQSKEQMEAKLLSKQEAAVRRERALAYAFSHQTLKNTPKSANPTFMDPSNPHWGWSWLERWMASRPWESRSTAESQQDRASTKSTTYHQHHRREPSRESKASPRPRHSPSASSVTAMRTPKEEDSRSGFSVQSERVYRRRHSIAGSSVRDDGDSLASSASCSSSVPSYMAPTQSAKAKSRLPSPLGFDRNGPTTPDKASSVKKRLSFHAASPAGPRRHSGPPKFDTTTTIIKDIGLNVA